MEEEKLLNETLKILGRGKILEAYHHISINKEKLKDLSSQVYNFLYCLASLTGKKDEDLDCIRNEELFKNYEKISYERYLSAKKYAKTICTWQEKTKDKLIFALHGNQENIDIARDNWKFIEDYEYQVECIQSKNLDSYNLFRWEEDEVIQINEILEKIPLNKYKERVLGGFSSGCNEILKTILKTNITCEKLILVSPWIPIIKGYLQDFLKIINKRDIIVQIICGKEDEDCYPLVELIKANSSGNRNIQIIIVEDIGHEFSESFKKIVKKQVD